jgi:hypothetical protein
MWREPALIFWLHHLENWSKIGNLPLDHPVSGPGEFHPEALAELYVSLSTHTAPIKEPPDVIQNGFASFIALLPSLVGSLNSAP